MSTWQPFKKALRRGRPEPKIEGSQKTSEAARSAKIVPSAMNTPPAASTSARAGRDVQAALVLLAALELEGAARSHDQRTDSTAWRRRV